MLYYKMYVLPIMFFFSDFPTGPVALKFFSLVISQWVGLWDKDWRWGGGVLRNNFQRQSLGENSNLRKRIIRLKFAREKIYEKPHLCRKTSEKNNIGELGSTRA